jgi:hypothetical protein
MEAIEKSTGKLVSIFKWEGNLANTVEQIGAVSKLTALDMKVLSDETLVITALHQTWGLRDVYILPDTWLHVEDEEYVYGYYYTEDIPHLFEIIEE